MMDRSDYVLDLRRLLRRSCVGLPGPKAATLLLLWASVSGSLQRALKGHVVFLGAMSWTGGFLCVNQQCWRFRGGVIVDLLLNSLARQGSAGFAALSQI